MERWSGPFANPNLAGLELALLAVAAVAIAARGWSGRGAATLRVSAALIAIAAIAGLAATGSRAGGLAMAAGLATLTVLRALSWRWAVTGFAILATAMLASGAASRLVPDGAGRGVADRFSLWQASLALIVDHPLGIGSGLPTMLDSWYLPEGLRLRFATALNDVLTITALWGLPVAGLAAAVLAILLTRTAAMARNGNMAAAMATSLCAVHLVAGMFQAHLFAVWSTARWSGAAVLALLVATAVGGTRGWRTPLAAGAVAGVMLPACVALCGLVWGEAAWRTGWREGLLVATPRHATAAGLVVVRHHAEERQAIIAELAPQVHAGGLAMALDEGRWLPQRADRLLIMGTGDCALQLWRDWRAGRLPPGAATAIIDPDGPPEQDGPNVPRGRLLVLPLATNLIPDLASLRAALRADQACTPDLVVLNSRNWTQAWPAVAAWWRRWPGDDGRSSAKLPPP